MNWTNWKKKAPGIKFARKSKKRPIRALFFACTPKLPDVSWTMILIWWWKRHKATDRWNEMVAGHLHSAIFRRHKVFGPLFSGRYKALVVDGTAGVSFISSECNPSPLKKPEGSLS
jgi:hypothetical protein